MSTEETRYSLNGIFLHTLVENAPMLRAVATDGHRLALAEIDAPLGALGMPGIIMPRELVKELKWLVHDGDIGVETSRTRTRFTLNSGKTIIVSKTVDGTYPNYKKVIPDGTGIVVTVARSAFLAAVSRCCAVSSKLPVIKLISDGCKLRLSLEDDLEGRAVTCEIYAAITASMNIGFNASYLNDLLQAIDDDETVVMTITDHASPVLFRGQGDLSALYVLMPVRC